MHVITFFAPKGRAGRTLATITAAMALVKAGKRVHVLDLTDPRMSEKVPLPGDRTGYSTGLVVWGLRMNDAGIGADKMRVEHVRGFQDFSYDLSTAEIEDADVVLIDTPSRPTDLTLAAIDRSNLAVTPATTAMDAKLIFHSIKKHYSVSMPTMICGLATGTSGPEEDKLVKAAFSKWPSFRTVLPYSSSIPAQFHGRLLFNGPDQRGAEGAAQQAGRAFGKELLKVAGGYLPGPTLPAPEDGWDWRNLNRPNLSLWQ
ncbi:MAG: ParA family protein [Rhodobacteraceae bacterium]|nr:MAG: ParA family protein [Paracoccaceae bacterium]